MPNLYYCSDGTRLSEGQIKTRYTQALREKHGGQTVFICECGCNGRAINNDHTIAKARCKVIHKTELIFDPNNFVSSCDKAHKEWEAFKEGEWISHANMEQRLAYLKEHDPEGYKVRIELTIAKTKRRCRTIKQE